MGARPITERVAEVKEKREKAKKKVEQYDEQIKRLEKQDADEKRKRRTHALVVCGAELAALFGKVLDENEVLAVVNFLREQQNAGVFTLKKQKAEVAEEPREPSENTQGNEEEPFGGLFNF